MGAISADSVGNFGADRLWNFLVEIDAFILGNSYANRDIVDNGKLNRNFFADRDYNVGALRRGLVSVSLGRSAPPAVIAEFSVLANLV